MTRPGEEFKLGPLRWVVPRPQSFFNKMQIANRQVAQVLSPGLTKKLREFRNRMGLDVAGYGGKAAEWHGAVPAGWAEFPQLIARRSRVYSGMADSFAYSHHQSICKFKGRYVVAWSNGPLHEDDAGQQVHYACSRDLEVWEPNKVVVATDPDSGVVRNQAGLYADDGYVYCFVCHAEPYGRDEPGMSSILTKKMRLDLYRSSDLESWEEFKGFAEDVYLFEGPRLTREGKLLCSGINQANQDEAKILIWDAADPTVAPQTVTVDGSAQGVRPQQGTWYQTDDGRIWVWQRDAGHLTRLALTWSDDGGGSWSPMVSTDFPNTFSRAHAGRLTDGRFYLIGNNFDQYLNRLYMHIAISDDGTCFDRMYTLLQGETTRRVPGRHKENGYHYPHSMVEGDRLIVVYSVNKENIEVAVVDTQAFA